MNLLGITAIYIFLYVPILWICTYPVYWLNKKTKSKVNPFLMRLELEFLGSSLSSLVRVLLGGIYIIFFGLLYCIVFFYTLMVTGNFIFSWFGIWEEKNLWNPLWVCLKQTRANNYPPLLMRLLCLGVWSKTLYIWDFLKKCIAKCIANECFFCTTSARTNFIISIFNEKITAD